MSSIVSIGRARHRSPNRIAVAALAGTVLSIAGAMDREGANEAYYWFSHWVSVGDLDAAAAQFAEDAVVVVAPSCPLKNPCRGRAEIRTRYVEWVARHPAARPLIDQRLDGSTMYAHDALSYRTRVSGTSDWRQNRYAFHLREGRIESLVFGDSAEEYVAAHRGIARSTALKR